MTWIMMFHVVGLHVVVSRTDISRTGVMWYGGMSTLPVCNAVGWCRQVLVWYWYGTRVILGWYQIGRLRYNHLLCHTRYIMHPYYTLHLYYTLLHTTHIMRYVMCIIYVFNVRASSWTAKAAHSRKAEAPSYRGCPSPLRSFGAAPLKTTKDKM